MQESFAVMAVTSVSMRDPIFYRWHEFLDNLFYSFIDTLPPYTSQEVSKSSMMTIFIKITKIIYYLLSSPIAVEFPWYHHNERQRKYLRCQSQHLEHPLE